MDVAYPSGRERRPRVGPVDIASPDLADPASANAWLDVEMSKLHSVARHAAEHDRLDLTAHLSVTLHRHMRTRAQLTDAESLHDRALAAARASGDRVGELEVLIGLGQIRWLQALRSLGHVHRSEGRRAQAAEYFEQALVVARSTGSRYAEIGVLIGLGWIHRLDGRREESGRAYESALTRAREVGNMNWQFEAQHGLGRLYLDAGRPDRALGCHEAALELAVVLGQALDEARAHDGMARACFALATWGFGVSSLSVDDDATNVLAVVHVLEALCDLVERVGLRRASVPSRHGGRGVRRSQQNLHRDGLAVMIGLVAMACSGVDPCATGQRAVGQMRSTDDEFVACAASVVVTSLVSIAA
jgi:tetratricopeptide (TPR) repeat protein